MTECTHHRHLYTRVHAQTAQRSDVYLSYTRSGAYLSCTQSGAYLSYTRSDRARPVLVPVRTWYQLVFASPCPPTPQMAVCLAASMPRSPSGVLLLIKSIVLKPAQRLDGKDGIPQQLSSRTTWDGRGALTVASPTLPTRTHTHAHAHAHARTHAPSTTHASTHPPRTRHAESDR